MPAPTIFDHSAVKLDPAHALTAGRLAYYLPQIENAGVIRNVVGNGGDLTRFGSPSLISGPDGTLAKGASASGWAVLTPDVFKITGDLTIAWTGTVPDGGALDFDPILATTHNANDQAPYISWGAFQEFSPGTQATCARNNSGYQEVPLPGVFTLNDGASHAFVWTVTAAGAWSYYRDGVLFSSGTMSGGTITYTATAYTSLCCHVDPPLTSRYAGAAVRVASLWNVALAQARVLEYSADPYAGVLLNPSAFIASGMHGRML